MTPRPKPFAFSLLLLTLIAPAAWATPNPTTLLQQAMDQWRGKTSYTEISMHIHRPDWDRTMSMKGWTRGNDDSLVRFTRPARDAGNASLKLGDDMWIFNPKVNQVIKLPASMMSQSWMGSDFSYNDIAKSNSLLVDYSHTLVSTQKKNGHEEYTIDAKPKPGAPVVWGKQRVVIRDDHVLLKEIFYDQDMKPVREMDTLKIAPLGGRPFPVRMKMRPVDKPDQWTRIDYSKGVFNLKLPGYLFTRSNLRNPRPWSMP